MYIYIYIYTYIYICIYIHRKFATPEGNSRLSSNCPNSKAPQNSFGF